MTIELSAPLPSGALAQPSRALAQPSGPLAIGSVERTAAFPRLRYMGSKYRLVPALDEVFASLDERRAGPASSRGAGAPTAPTALDAFSGSGVVSYLLKSRGYAVTSNDFLTFPTIIASAAVANRSTRLGADAVDRICSGSLDGRDFIRSTFDGLYLNSDDLDFLDSAWSHIDLLEGFERDVAISALVLAAARKQPRGVFTYTGNRYDDGRRDLRLTMAEQFRRCVDEYNTIVFDTGAEHRVLHGDVAAVDGSAPDGTGFDLVYLDPPYAPPRDDADYMKRYHFLEGLSVYWRGQTIMQATKTKKLEKKFTPFAYKRTIEGALATTFEQFADAGAIVLSYSSNALPGKERIVELLRAVKPVVEVRSLDHRYSFGTHGAVQRAAVSEYIFIGTDR